MYIKNEQCQQKNIQNIHVTWKTSPSFNKNIEEYLDSLSYAHRKVAEYFLRFRYAEHVRLTNGCIAEHVGCSVRTVQRATNALQKDGFIVKQQVSRYTPNDFKLSPATQKGKHAYSYWLNSLSEESKELFYTHGIYKNAKGDLSCQYEYVIQNNNYINYIYLSNNPIPHNARARAWLATESQTVIDGDGEGFLTKQERERKEHVKRGLKMISDLQKEWLLENGNDPRVQDLMNNEKIRSALIIPEIEELTTLLSLNNREQFKLIAFRQDALKYVLTFVRPVVEGTKKTKEPIRDRMGWLMSMLLNYCKQRHIEPDWNFYYKLCEITKIPSLVENEEPRPLVVKFKQRTKNIGHSCYDLYVKEVVDPVEREKFLIQEIQNCEKNLAHLHKNFDNFCREYSIKYCEKELEAYTNELAELHKSKPVEEFQQSIATA